MYYMALEYRFGQINVYKPFKPIVSLTFAIEKNEMV